MFYSTDMKAKSARPFMSLKDIVNYKAGKLKLILIKVLLKGKDDLNLGKAKKYPTGSEYGGFEYICDW